MYPEKTRVGDVESNLDQVNCKTRVGHGRGQHEMNVQLRRKDVSLTSSPHFHDLEG